MCRVDKIKDNMTFSGIKIAYAEPDKAKICKKLTCSKKNMIKEKILMEDYKFTKKELQESISSQYKILSVLVTASAASFVYLFTITGKLLTVIACLIIPGIYCFLGYFG